jgi:hypothetical protein
LNNNKRKDSFDIGKSPSHVNAKTGKAVKSSLPQYAGTRSSGSFFAAWIISRQSEPAYYLPEAWHTTQFLRRVLYCTACIYSSPGKIQGRYGQNRAFSAKRARQGS